MQTSATTRITPANLSTEIYMAGRIYEMQQIVFVFVFVQHATCLGFYGNASFALHVQLVEDLLVASGLDGAGELE